MIKGNEIIFKNSRVEELIEKNRLEAAQFGFHTSERMKREAEKSIQELGEGIIAGYWYSLLNDAMMDRLRTRKWIDFTYETIERLPYSLISLYMLQKDVGYSRDRNAAVIGKTIGAVMYGLAMNEHGYALTVERGKEEPLWADLFNIYVDGKQRVDFLAPALQAIGSSSIMVQTGVFVDMTPVIKAYKVATGGIDLSEFGLANITINET